MRIKTFNHVALLDFQNVIGPDGSNSNKTSHFVGFVMLKNIYSPFYNRSFSNVCLWEKIILGQCASHDRPGSCNYTIWPLGKNWLHSLALFLGVCVESQICAILTMLTFEGTKSRRSYRSLLAVFINLLCWSKNYSMKSNGLADESMVQIRIVNKLCDRAKLTESFILSQGEVNRTILYFVLILLYIYIVPVYSYTSTVFILMFLSSSDVPFLFENVVVSASVN